MGVECEIIFDENRDVFYPTETITGQVKYTLDTPKKIQGIQIKFKGIAETRFTRSHQTRGSDGKSRTTHTTYTGEELYFRSSNYLIGGSGEEFELAPNTYQYTFSFKLPPGIPSSFEGDSGHVRYRVKTVMERPWKFDHDTVKHFTVLCPLDLNLIPHLKDPVHMYLEKTFCFSCSGPVKVNVACPMTGFYPGQILPVDIKVDNQSSKNIPCIEICLRKHVTFHAHYPRPEIEVSKNTEASVRTEGIARYSSKQFTVNLTMPSMPPSDLPYCSIIGIKYLFKAICKTGFFHCDENKKVPVTIGTVPICANGQVPFAPAINVPVESSHQFANMQQGFNPNNPSPYPNVMPYPNAMPYSNVPSYPNVTPYPNNVPYPNALPSYPASPSAPQISNNISQQGYPPPYTPQDMSKAMPSEPQNQYGNTNKDDLKSVTYGFVLPQ